MVLESLLNPFVLKQKPWEMFFAGFIHSIIAIALAYAVFPTDAGLMMVFLIVLGSLPTLYVTIKNEEKIDLKYKKEWRILKEHTKVITFLIFLFLGITLALVLAYVFLPVGVVDTLFSVQHQAVEEVNVYVTGNITKFDIFSKILINNTRVLFFCIIFSLLYGTGAIFILTWNASTVAAAMGQLFKAKIAETASYVGLTSIAGYFGAATFSFFRYMTHGFFEIAAYFVAGLAGSILSVALIKYSLKQEKAIVDSIYLMLISFGILIVAGVVEVYITPRIFGL